MLHGEAGPEAASERQRILDDLQQPLLARVPAPRAEASVFGH